MTAPVGSLAFAALLWGSVAGVLLVLLYEAYAVARELGVVRR